MAMAIAAPHPLELPRQHLFWNLHLGRWLAYFGLGCLSAIAHDEPPG
jgi:two-component system, LytTR family, sensor kinase